MSRSLQLGTVVGLITMGLSMVGCGGAADESSTEDPALVSSEANKPSPAPKKISYLALGDSIAFGFDPLVTTPQNPAAYVGYPEAVKAKKKNNVDLVNASCPGETSGSFLSTTAADNGCRNWKAAYSLHNDYETTQIAFVESVIKADPAEQYVSINIGANDLLLVQNGCATAANPLACIQAALPGTLAAYGQNLGTIYARIKAAGFKGKFVGVNLYATNYADLTVSVPAITALNNVMLQVTTSPAVGGVVADVFKEFKTASGASGDACAAGLLIKKPDGTCDIHPSPKGRDIIAAAGIAAAKM